MGVALVASAAKGLTKSTCKERLTMSINAAAAVSTFYCHPTWIYPAAIAAGGFITFVLRRKEVCGQLDFSMHFSFLNACACSPRRRHQPTGKHAAAPPACMRDSARLRPRTARRACEKPLNVCMRACWQAPSALQVL